MVARNRQLRSVQSASCHFAYSTQARWSVVMELLTGMFSDLVAGLDVKRRWLVCFLGLAVLALAVALFQSHDGRKANAPRIVVLATWYSNGQQLVTFRLDPPSAEITYADLVSVSNDGNAQPPTVRRFDRVIPVRKQSDPDFSLHFVALPIPAATNGGLTYTLGSYTVACAPSAPPPTGCGLEWPVSGKELGTICGGFAIPWSRRQ